MMKFIFRFLTVFVLLFTSKFSSAQDSTYFSADSEVFMNQVESLLLKSHNKNDLEKGQQLILKMKEPWNLGRFNKEEKDMIKAIAERLHSLKRPIYPDFYNYISVIQLFIESKQPASSTMVWFKTEYENASDKSLKSFDDLLLFTKGFLENNVLREKNGIAWLAKKSQYRFISDSVLKINFERMNLVCASRKDSSVINNTSGIYNINSGHFYGVGGKVYWWRFGFKPEETWVELSNMHINLNEPGYTADSTFFYHTSKFDQKLAGRFTDKVMSSAPNLRTTYPRFETYNDLYSLKEVFPSIQLSGQIIIEGGTIFAKGSATKNAEMIFRRNNKVYASIRSISFTIGDDKVTSENVKAKFMVENDSIFHPELRMRYVNENRTLILYRLDGGIGEAPFSDSYHKVDLYFPALTWIIDSDELILNKLDGVSTESSGRVESESFYSDRDYQLLKGMDDIHPMMQIDMYLKAFDSGNSVPLYAYSDFIKKPSEQVLTQFLRLAAKGFLVYDQDSRIATVNERFYNILSSRAGKTDYDVIRLQSFTTSRKPNIVFNFINSDLTVYGVKTVILSDTQHVVIQPREEKVVMKKNRDFAFSGPVQAGLFTFYARDCSFEYEKFQLNFTYIDSISFLVKSRTTRKANEDQRYIKVKNVLANLTGNLKIDDPGNKSGLKRLSHYPVFESKGESYVYFDKKFIMDGALNREKFYYSVDPFVIDSLLTFSTDELKFKGYLTSAAIFPVFGEPLTVMEDYSLGFQHFVNESGYPMFGGKAKFYDDIHLSNKGFFGNGHIDYLTSNAISDTFCLYPDSVTALVHQFNMAEKASKVEFPRGQADSIAFDWQINEDIVHLQTVKKPYIVFNNAILEGKMDISPSGMTGRGSIAFSNASIRSDSLRFFSQAFTADSADFQLYTAETHQEAFAALGYKVAIDFRDRVGNFTFMGSNSLMSFPFNQYVCSLDEAYWIMDEDKLILNNNRVKRLHDLDNLNHNQIMDIDLSGSGFISTHPQQDSLSFFCLEADYNLVDYTINARNVKIIRVADAAVFPNDGLVTIGKNAIMSTLQSATIITDTLKRFHTIYEALVDISSRKSYSATGKYHIKTSAEQPLEIQFTSIHVDSTGRTVAEAKVESVEPLRISPEFDICGRVILNSDQQFLRYQGGFRIIEPCNTDGRPFVAFDTVVDPFNVRIPIHKPVDLVGNTLSLGYYRDMVTGKYYGRFLEFLRQESDQEIVSQSGDLFYDPTAKIFKLESFGKQRNNRNLELRTNRCIIGGKGPVDLDLSMPFMDIRTYGTIDYSIIPDSVSLNLFLRFDFIFDSKLLEMMADSLNTTNQKALNLSEGNYTGAISGLLNSQDAGKIENEISLYGFPRKVPDELQKTLVISEVHLRYQESTNSFISIGPIGISNINQTAVNKYVNGYLEIEKGRTTSAFTLYLQLNSKQWYYFDFKNGVVQAISSSVEFNDNLMSISDKKRIKLNQATGDQYEFVISTRRKVADFLNRMQAEIQ
jgi:hypothetical protein